MTHILDTLVLLATLTITQAFPTTVVNETLKCLGGSYTTGQRAGVTCFFQDDLSVTFHQIYVTRQGFGPAGKTETALICFKLHNKDLQCNVADGYSFDQEIAETLTLTIPRVEERFAGKYACRIVPPVRRAVETCDLIVQEKPTPKPSVPHTAATPVKPVPQGNDAGLSQNPKFQLALQLMWLTIMSICLLGILVSLISCCCTKCCEEAKPPQTQEAMKKTPKKMTSQGSSEC